jgi:hypothetical protein
VLQTPLLLFPAKCCAVGQQLLLFATNTCRMFGVDRILLQVLVSHNRSLLLNFACVSADVLLVQAEHVCP